MKKERHVILKFIYRFILLFCGAVIAAIGLDVFLIPNDIIDGGIVGISIMASVVTNIPVGLFTFLLNIPFLFIGYKQIGKTFVISSLFSITVFSLCTQILTIYHIKSLTDDMLLATIFGGIVLGIGVGIILRNSGSLDGTEIIALILNEKSLFSVGQIVMFFNVAIFACAAFVLDWDSALYSMLAYFLAHKAIDVVVQGFDEAKAVMVISDKSEEIAEVITDRLGRGVTFLDGYGGYTKDEKKVIYSVITRLEVSKMRAIITEIDERAFVTIFDVSDVMGGNNQKRAIH